MEFLPRFNADLESVTYTYVALVSNDALAVANVFNVTFQTVITPNTEKPETQKWS